MAVKSNISTNVAIGANLSGLTRGLKIASSKMRRFGNQAKSIGSTLSRGISLPLAGLGAISVKTFSEFEAEMSKVKAVSGATEAQFKKLETQAKALGASTTFTASEVAGLQSEFAKLGFTADEIDKVTESTLFLAQAGGAELARAAEVAGATLRAFGLDAEETGRVTDVMASSFASSSLDMESFAEAMKTVAPIANATGVTLEEASGMLGALANNGIKGSIAGTALKKILSELHQEGKPLNKTIQELSDKNISLSEAEELVGERAKGALLILAEQKGTVDELTETFINADGAAKGMAETMMDNTAGAFKILQSTTEGALIEIGEAITENQVFQRVLEKLTTTITKITKHIQGMSDAEQYNNVVLAGLLAVVPLIITAIGSLTIAFGSLTAAMGPVGIAIAGVTALYLGLRKEVDLTQKAVDKALASEDAEKSAKELQDRYELLTDSIIDQGNAIKDYVANYSNPFYDAEETRRYKQLNTALEKLKAMRDKVSAGLDKLREKQAEANKETEKSTEVTKKYESAVSVLAKTLNADLAPSQERAKQLLDGVFTQVHSNNLFNYREGLERLNNTQAQAIDLTSGLALEFSQNLGNAIAGAIVNGDNFAESFITALKAMAAQLIATIALVAVLAALLIVATGGLAGLSFKGLLSAMKIVSKTSGIGIPFLAEGGIVTGPTLAMIGEGGESEAVIPLSKLPQIAGANGGAVEVYGRISGQDILLSSEKAGRVRSRYRGF